MTPTLQDARLFLARLIEDCDGCDEHSWRTCRRCSALAQVQDRDPLALKLIAALVAETPAPETPPAEGKAPCPTCVSEHGMVFPTCSTCHGTGQCPSAAKGPETPADPPTTPTSKSAL